MGIDFRDGSYTRRVRLGKRTVKDGEAVAIWDRSGRHYQVIGPKLVYLFYSTIRFLNRHVANENQYIVVEKADGSLEHFQGPCAVWENPVKYRKVTVKNSINLLSERDCVVVISDNPSKTSKTAVHGPARYFLKPYERLEVFSWTTSSGVREDGNTLQAKHARFEPTLPMGAPQQSVSLSVQYSMSDPLYLVECTDDFTGQLFAALRADTLTLQTAEEVRGLGITQLRIKLPTLFALCDRFRVQIEAVTVLKTQLSEQGQKLQEENTRVQRELAAKEESTKLKIRLAALELEGESAQLERRNELAKQELENKIELAKREHDATALIAAQKTRDTVAFLQELKALDVDVTRVVCEALNSKETNKPPASIKAIAEGLMAAFGGARHQDD